MSLIFCLFAIYHLAISISRPNFSSFEKLGKVNLIKNPSHVDHGSLGYVRTMKKYNIAPTHPGALLYHEIVFPDLRLLRRDVTLGLTGASLTPDTAQYLSSVSIGDGDNAKTFSVVFDSGSADFWLFSNLMGEDVVQMLNGTQLLYDPLNPTTAIATGQTFNISYDDGSHSDGIVFRDTVTIGGIVIENQTVEAAVQVNDFLRIAVDDIYGVLGLSPLSMNNTSRPGKTPDLLTNLFFGESEHSSRPYLRLLLPVPMNQKGSLHSDTSAPFGVQTVNISPSGE